MCPLSPQSPIAHPPASGACLMLINVMTLSNTWVRARWIGAHFRTTYSDDVFTRYTILDWFECDFQNHRNQSLLRCLFSVFSAEFYLSHLRKIGWMYQHHQRHRHQHNHRHCHHCHWNLGKIACCCEEKPKWPIGTWKHRERKSSSCVTFALCMGLLFNIFYQFLSYQLAPNTFQHFSSNHQLWTLP